MDIDVAIRMIHTILEIYLQVGKHVWNVLKVLLTGISHYLIIFLKKTTRVKKNDLRKFYVPLTK